MLINEFQSNPPGTDPATQTFELRGTPGATFTGVLISIESDTGSGIVDRVANISGTFDANGLLTEDVPDLENPSFTVVLLESFTGTTGTDIDTNNDGTADNLSSFGTVLDAIGVPDAAGDEIFLYGAQLGGVDFAYTGDEPEIIFRDGNTTALYAVNLIGTPEVFDTTGTDIGAATFKTDPTTGTTFGAVNPSTTLPPEINVQGNSTNIVDGDTTPAITDHTDFGTVDTVAGAHTNTFTIQNTGTADLNVTGITVSGVDATDFTIQNFTAGTVTAGGTLNFDVVFTPSADGLRTATIEIANNDADEGTFDFTIQGTSTSIENGTEPPAITPSIIGIDRDNSDEEAGVVALLGSLTLSFAINSNDTSFVNELVVFTVEDDDGTVLDANGHSITPTASPGVEQEDYLNAILESQDTHVVFSTLNTSDNLPDAFTSELSTLGTTLDVDSDSQLGFMLIADGTYDELQANPKNKSFFLSTTGGAEIDILSTESLVLRLKEDEAGVFDDLEISITAAAQDELLDQPGELPKIGRSIRIQDDFVEAIDLLNLSFDFNGDAVVDDLTGAAVTVGIDIFREAAFDNLIGFFAIDPVTGAVDGILPTAANRLAYAEAAFNSAVGVVNSPGNESTLSATFTFIGDQLLLPFMIADDTIPTENFSNIYFPFLELNSDGVDHIRLLGNGVFGFEDLPGGGDQDFDDVIIQITTVALA
ncbi:hypothetical protein Lepto7375DRAFT_5842 [Leptolyngbya sp. PCC 7375]|nr:hypothetical protein Lepto7375DRAFT_5842 [Leptolyngbya sp. PCC 7375]